MKKIFTFLISMMALSSVFAQSGSYHRNNSNYDNNTTAWNNGNGYDRNDHNSSYYDHQDNKYDKYGSENSYSYKRGHNDYYEGYNHGRNNDRNNAYDNYNNYRRPAPVYNRGEIRSYHESNGSSKLKAVGAGLIVGGIIALIAGSR